MRVRGDVTTENSKREIGKCYAVALKLQEGATSQGMQVISRRYKSKETFSLRASKRNAALKTPRPLTK